ncbi:MAG TPA: hypothetical protein DCE42_03755 [Myxococcales bacterium]|nr:hypothetical protein [Deltaproteobacteria bacterium]HAA53840.1 hypothetical protein [Myxococcales bacterium]|tara:strand:+ start:10983 stop:12989 length:2007 start_codon:yes stop_codon:yes gene_type:complete
MITLPRVGWFSSEEIKELLAQTNRLYQLDIPDDIYLYNESFEEKLYYYEQNCLDAYLFLAGAAASILDTSMLKSLLHKESLFSRYRRDDSHGKVMVLNLVELCKHPNADVSCLESLANHKDSSVRRFLAESLTTEHLPFRPFLQELVYDPVPTVREKAAARWGVVEDVPWWAGVFFEDPTPRLFDVQRKTDVHLCFELAELLSTPKLSLWELDPDVREGIEEILAQLPPFLAAEVAEARLRAPEHAQKGAWWGPWLFASDDGHERFLRLWRRWEKLAGDGYFYLNGFWDEWVDALPVAKRDACCDLLWPVLMEASNQEVSMPMRALCDAFALFWPKERELTPVLTFLLENPKEKDKYHHIKDKLGYLFAEHAPAHPALLSQVKQAFLDGFPAPWDCISDRITSCLKTLPDEEREAFAWRALESDTKSLKQWGFGLLAERFGEDVEAQKTWLLESLEDPELEPLFWNDSQLYRPVLPHLRMQFREGTLDVDRAFRVFAKVGREYGGCISYMDLINKVHPTDSVFFGSQSGDDVWDEDEKDTEGLEVPVTEKEWELLRKIRAEHPLTPELFENLAFFPMPDGEEWHPVDRDYFEQALVFWHELNTDKNNRRQNFAVFVVLAFKKPLKQDLPVFYEACERVTKSGRSVFSVIHWAKQRIASYFGEGEEEAS